MLPKVNAGEKDCPTVRVVLSKLGVNVGFFENMAVSVAEAGAPLSCEGEEIEKVYSACSLTIFPDPSCHPSKA